MKNKETVIKFFCLFLYSAFTLLVVLNHEYWFDEGQAWNIARDNDIAGIIRMMKYEGHPPLWHFLLKIFISIGCSSAALGLISWGVSVITAGLILFALPIKPYFKAALLLCGSMLYFNTAISRVYCLIELLLVLLAIIYPKRKQHPVLFGLTVGLLADTHIIMCGLVGILGIYMLIDLFREWKTSDIRQNLGRLSGLAVAGAGVLLLVLPMLGSMSANSVALENKYSFSSVLSSLGSALPNIFNSADAVNLPIFIGLVLCIISEAAFIWFLIIAWKKRFTFLNLVFFTVMFIVVDEVIWYSMPSRTSLFVFSLAVIYIMGREEEFKASDNKFKPDSKLFARLLDLYEKLCKEPGKKSSVLLSVCLAMTIPSAAVFAVRDIFGEFAPNKETARFISEKIPEDALLITYDDNMTPILTYLPGRKFFSLKYDRFYTYTSHEKVSEIHDFSALREELPKHTEIYGIEFSDSGFECVYHNENFISYQGYGQMLSVYKLGGGFEDLKSHGERLLEDELEL